MIVVHASVRRAIANEAGWIAGLDNMPRVCPPQYAVDERDWLRGYDEGAKRVSEADQKLKLVGIG